MEIKNEQLDINPKVLEIGKMNLTGNIFPNAWFQNIKKTNGKADLLAITLLAEIVYWYRPIEIRDEHTGLTITYRQKFKADILQKSYSELAEKFGRGKREVTESIILLEKLGLIKRVFRNIRGCSNVMFIDIFPQKIQDISILNTSQLVENLKKAEELSIIDELKR